MLLDLQKCFYLFFIIFFAAGGKNFIPVNTYVNRINNTNLAEKIWNPQTGKNLCRRVNENAHKNAIEG